MRKICCILVLLLSSNYIQSQSNLKIEKKQEELILDGIDVEDANFVGGQNEMQKWIYSHIIYPQSWLYFMNTNGVVHVSFVIEVDGHLSGIKLEKGMNDCPECDAEALRLVSTMPKWKPGREFGKEVPVRCRLPIKFSVN